MFFLFLDIECQRILFPSTNGPIARNESPRPVISILITSAPKSARIFAAKGAAITFDMSRILTPPKASTLLICLHPNQSQFFFKCLFRKSRMILFTSG